MIILTLNEAANIETCLRRLAWADDIIIVDSFSKDGTLDICRSVMPGCRIFQNAFQDFGQQRNWALDNAFPQHEWVLFVDADELMTEALAKEIQTFIAAPGMAVGAYIAGRNYFLGRWIRHCSYYPSYQLRLLRRGCVRFAKEGHGQKEMCNGPTAYLAESWRHEGFSKGIADWINKHNRYSDEEVDLLVRLRNEPLVLPHLLARDRVTRRRAVKRLAARTPCRPLVRFLYTYLARRGFLDGYAGLIYCLLYLTFEIQVQAKLAERRFRHQPAIGRPRRPGVPEL